MQREYAKTVQDNLCLFRVLSLHLHGIGGLKEDTSKMFNLFLEKIRRSDPSSFQSVCMIDTQYMADLVQVNIFLCHIDVLDGAMIGEPATKSDGKYSNAAQVLRYNSHFCNVSNIKAFFKTFRCPTCDHFDDIFGNLVIHSTSFIKQVKHIFPESVHQLRETLSQIDLLGIPYTDNQKPFDSMAVLDF